MKGLIKIAEEYDYDFRILKAIDDINQRQKMLMVEKIKKHFKGKVKGKIFTLWGLSYKPRTDDIREAPARTIADALMKSGAKVQAFDPAANENFKQLYKGNKNIKIYSNNYSALKNSNGLILVTEWNEFRRIDIEKMKSLMKTYVVFDGRNIYDPKILRAKGFSYYGVGR